MNPDTQIRVYLLGTLSTDQTDSVEKELFADDAFFDLVQATEGELIRDYVCNDLSGPERAQFEKKYLSNPRLRAKVDAEKALHAVISEDTESPKPVEVETWLNRFAGRFAFRRPALALAWATALALAVIGIIFWHSARSGTSPTSDGSAELRQTKPPKSSNAVLASFVLVPGTPREAREYTNHLIVPSEARTLRLNLELHAPGSYRSFRGQILFVGPSGLEPVFTFNDLQPKDQPPGTVVSVDLDASVLQRGDYILRLAGQTGTGSFEDLPSYTFAVDRQ